MDTNSYRSLPGRGGSVTRYPVRFMEDMNARPAVARVGSGRCGNVRFDASALLIAQTEKGRRPFYDPG